MTYSDHDYDRAEYEAEMAEQAAARAEPYVGEPCEWCAEPMETPLVFQAPKILGGTYEAACCSEDCKRETKYPSKHVGEDFRADWDPYYQVEPEWDDATGERLY